MPKFENRVYLEFYVQVRTWIHVFIYMLLNILNILKSMKHFVYIIRLAYKICLFAKQ
jgi:hypothetical protein